MFEIEIDWDACDNVFACLARDGRLIGDDNGFTTTSPDAAGVVRVEQTDGHVVIILKGGMESDDDVTLATRVCPPGTISVRGVDA